MVRPKRLNRFGKTAITRRASASNSQPMIKSSAKRVTKHRPFIRCDQEVSKRTLATRHKVCEEVSNKEMRDRFEPCDVQVSLPRRAAEQSKVRSSGDNVPTSASLDVEVDEGKPERLNTSEESP